MRPDLLCSWRLTLQYTSSIRTCCRYFDPVSELGAQQCIATVENTVLRCVCRITSAPRVDSSCGGITISTYTTLAKRVPQAAHAAALALSMLLISGPSRLPMPKTARSAPNPDALGL